MLCVPASETLPITFDGDARSNCRPGCPRTVGLEVQTRVGSGTATGCGVFEDPENPGTLYMTRTSTAVWRFYRTIEGVRTLVGTSTLTTVESREGDAIVTGDDECGTATSDASWSPDPPELYDDTETEPTEYSYEDGFTAEDVCNAANGAIVWGEWSAWGPILNVTDEWKMDIDRGAAVNVGVTAGAFLGLVLAVGNAGYGSETKLRIKGGYPIQLAIVTYNSNGDLMGIDSETLMPGVERYFAAPSAASCALDAGTVQVTIELGCVAPVHLCHVP
jgi:hypothetical protein